jgi:hypothetical protein
VIATGIDPHHLHALHSCDRPQCCNPAHLRWGTVTENMQDKIQRGRFKSRDQSGTSNGAAKLSSEDLAKIVDGFRANKNNMQIAATVPVTHSMVSKIRCGHMWKDQAAALGWSPNQSPTTGSTSHERA